MNSFLLWFVISFVLTTVASAGTTAWTRGSRRRGNFTPDLTRPPLESTFDTHFPARRPAELDTAGQATFY